MMVRLSMVPVVIMLASGCRSAPPLPGENVLQILAEGRLLHELKATGGKVTLGNRALVDDGKVIHGHGRRGAWRMRREGKQLHGKVEGKPARITVLQDATQVAVMGNIGHKTLKIRAGVEAVLISFHDMDLQLARQKKTPPGDAVRVFCEESGVYCLRLHPTLTLKHPELPLALWICAVQLLDVHLRRQRSLDPGWSDAKPNYFQSGGQWR